MSSGCRRILVSITLCNALLCSQLSGAPRQRGGRQETCPAPGGTCLAEKSCASQALSQSVGKEEWREQATYLPAYSEGLYFKVLLYLLCFLLFVNKWKEASSRSASVVSFPTAAACLPSALYTASARC